MRLDLCRFGFLLCAALISRQVFSQESLDRMYVTGAAQVAFFREGNYAKLETLSSELRKTDGRTSSGIWKLSVFYQGIGDGFQPWMFYKDWEPKYVGLQTRVSQWLKEFPRSPSAHLVQANLHLEHAWAYRGAGYAATVNSKDWKPFRRYLASARKVLEDSKALAAVDPQWYVSMLQVAKGQGWPRNEFDALLSEGLERHPYYYPIYFAAAEYLLPKWHGTVEDIEALASSALPRTVEKDGSSLYARIYWAVAQADFEDELFNSTVVQWPKMKAGFEDIIARYPSNWNLRSYARYACLAGDKLTLKKVIKRLGDNLQAEPGENSSVPMKCMSLALTD